MALLIHLALENQKTIFIPYTSSTIADEVCIAVCTKLNIGPLARHIFALRLPSKNFLHPTATFRDSTIPLEFRVRLKVASLAKLKKLDSNAYDYFYHQVRLDVIGSNVPDIVYEKHRAELLGLAITDMFRVVMENGVSKESVEEEYRKFVPKVLLKKHRFFVKKPIRTHLEKLEEAVKIKPFGVDFLKSQYLGELDLIAPEYLSETYRALIDVEGRSCFITIKVTPPNVPDSGVKYCWESKRDRQDWTHMCTVEELGFITTRDDASIEITRLSGIPIYIKFHKLEDMWSFVSLLDSYYRLTCKWTFSLCQNLITPSMKKLHSMRCHGPVGGEFSYTKLETKANNQAGCYIIRESETSFSSYYIDVCVKDRLSSAPKTFKLERLKENQYVFNNDSQPYSSLEQLIEAYSKPEGIIYLKECVYPSEYDISPLLLCRSENMVGEALTESSLLPELVLKNPVCINFKDLQVYKGQRKDGLRKITHVYRGMWKVTRGKKIEIALKFLKQDQEKHLKSYLSLMGQWAFVKSPYIVRFYGIALQSNDVSVVMEYFKLGPLDQYLRDNKSKIKTVDLIEATSHLASAVWHLRENDIVHGRIRCRKLMVHAHDDSCFTVKLTDNAVQTSYEALEVHWIAVECYTSEKRTAAADVWAMATTIYEMFTYGKELPVGNHMMSRYLNGDRLPRPAGCPEEIYTLMTECWHANPKTRKQSQEVSREVNHLLYQVYNSRKNHAYDVVGRSGINRNLNSYVDDSTETSELVSPSELDDSSTVRCLSSLSGASSQQRLLNLDESDGSSRLFSFLSNLTFSTMTTSQDSLTSVQSIFELDDSHDVVLKGCIGQGNYGQVFKGTMENCSDTSSEPIMVAVKKLKGSTLSNVVDFEREITIMKGLKHPNIVQILGVIRDPDLQLVMEFVPDGCLQGHLKHKKDELPISLLLKYASDIAEGMNYLGTKNIVHRDLAARNILVVERSHVKISDFGLAHFIGNEDYYMVRNTYRGLPIKWYAPESIGKGKFSVRSDVWSYGVTLYEMFAYGETPPELGNVDSAPEGQEQASYQETMLDAIYRGARYPCPEHCPQAIYFGVMKPCWELDPHARPEFKDLIAEVNKLKSGY
ncbi:tyrosine-protein kinase hopscotch-like isoform X2 [Euwallacea similis]|uniref:tyrosine-protein kinase hopscotch-like isoform X2 n=1 Tax=Euwallacea similis TaxID=1736056 RepID=UPI00344F7375